MKYFKRYPAAVGGEMEGVGIYAASSRSKVDWLVVKGIADWGDGAKDDRYQAVAAESAMSLVAQVLKDKNVLNKLRTSMDGRKPPPPKQRKRPRRTLREEALDAEVLEATSSEERRAITVVVRLSNRSAHANTIQTIELSIGRLTYKAVSAPSSLLIECGWLHPKDIRIESGGSTTGAWYFGRSFDGGGVEIDLPKVPQKGEILIRALRGPEKKIEVEIIPLRQRREAEQLKFKPKPEDRIIWRLPRGFLVLSQLYPAGPSWAVVIDSHDSEGLWLHATHFHSSYEDKWRTVKRMEVQCAKLRVPVADWVWAERVLYFAMAIRISPPPDLAEHVESHRTSGDPVLFVRANDAPRVIPTLEQFTLLARTGKLRDAIEEIDRLIHSEQPSWSRAREIAQDALLESAKLLGQGHPSVTVIADFVGRARPKDDVSAFARELSALLTPVASHLLQ